MRRWYVAQTHPHSESKAAYNLNRQGFTIYLPKYLKIRSHARRHETIRSPLFPRYIFIEIDLAADNWGPVRSTYGVHSLVSNGRDPIAVPDRILNEIRSRENDEGLISLNNSIQFRAGEPVRVLDGAFADQVGIFNCETDSDRVRVLLTLLGRTVPVSLPTASISASI